MDIDVSKENIQPLRGGRNLTQLGTALQAQSDHDAQRQLQLQKEEHEAAIANYQGSDPLDPWFNYIQWVEQSFPKHGHEGHIDKLIKDCLQLFEKDSRYLQDRRYVKLWIKYIDSRTNPLEIYQSLYNNGIGVECSEFYRAWACYCEESGDYKRANQVYMMGLQARAQPIDELEQAHMNFQLFFAQRMLHDDSPTKRKAASALAETRMALTSLRTFKRRNIANAPVQRVGENVRSFGPGVISQHSAYNERRSNSNAVINVYEDNMPSTSRVAVPSAEAPGPSSLVQSLSNVENEKEVGIWTKAKTKMVSGHVVPHHNLPFTPYEDEDDLKLPENHVPYCKDDLQFTVPLCVPDPPDPTKIPAYNKAQVYLDNTEYSIEEIKARKYQVKKNVKTEERESVDALVDHSDAQAAQCSALETLANCALDPEHDHLAHLMPLSVPAVQNIKVQNIHSPGEPKVLVNLDSKEFSELANPGVKQEENRQPFSVRDKENQAERPHVDAYPSSSDAQNYVRPHLAEEFNKSLMHNFLSDSVTINTKEARWELRNLFNDNATEPSMVQPVVPQFEVPEFDIHVDHSMTMALHSKKKPDLQDIIETSPPEDKENAKFTIPTAVKQQNVNKTTPYEETLTCTQVFNFNINDASTPNTSQFKKPNTYGEHAKMSLPKFSLDASNLELDPNEMPAVRKDQMCDMKSEHLPTKEIKDDLSVIMEATREYNSKSGSSSSGRQSTRTNCTGYTTTPYNEKTQASNFNSMYNNQSEQASTKRTSISTQPRLPNGQFARVYPQKNINENKTSTPSTSVPYLSHDHQYQKPVQHTYNGYTAQSSMQAHGYQQNYGISYQQGYANPQMGNQQAGIQQGYSSPSYQSPQHNMQSPHHSQSPAPSQPGFQSPPHHYAHQQVGYNSPGHQMQNSPQHYPNSMMRQDYVHAQGAYTNQEQIHVYANSPHSPAAFQSPPHPSQYTNTQYYQRTSAVNTSQNAGYPPQNYSMQNQYNIANVYDNQNLNQQSFNTTQNQYRHRPLSMPENVQRVAYGVVINNSAYQVYQSPTQPSHDSYRGAANQSATLPQDKCQPMVTSPPQQNNVSKENSHLDREDNQEVNARSEQIHRSEEQAVVDMHNNIGAKQKTPDHQPGQHKSPTSALRSIRHEQPHAKTNYNSADAGFSNQFLNFITGRNEPKDNANTPKFNSPNISQKMHKNLYVSSPEQAQIPPSTGHSDSDSKDGFTAASATPIQAAKVSFQMTEKQKDVSKRQLDFEQRTEVQSEDSRDSIGKESRISSVYSRQSDFQSDGYGMDVDSDSMDCAAIKSSHSISQIETSDIARPADIEFPQVIDPFSKQIIKSLLEYVKFPNKTHAEGYIEARSIPKVQVATSFTIGDHKFTIEKQLGKGNYGAVFLCFDEYHRKSVAVKYQKPSRPWEFYICQEIKARIKDPFMIPGYMDITTAILGDNASLFVSEYSKCGSLLDVANKVRLATSKCIQESIVFLLTSEMLSIIHYLHKAQIIHADIKPDNFLLMKIPTQEWRTPSLQLIDMGCAIDMSLFPEGTTFKELISTEGFTCTEMREGKPWTYQTDLYCLAGTIHVILMGCYMKVVNKLGQWNIDKKLPRYMKGNLWDKIFTTLLNVPDCNALPDLMDLKSDIDTLLCNHDQIDSHLRLFANILNSR